MIKLLILFLLIPLNVHAFSFGYQYRFGGNVANISQEFVDIESVLELSPTSHDFGSKDTGTNTDYAFTLDCTGEGACEQITPSVTGTGYSLLSTTCGTAPFDLASLATCEATVRFTPASAGTLTGSLVAAWTNQSDVVASLTGVGVVGSVAINLRQSYASNATSTQTSVDVVAGDLIIVGYHYDDTLATTTISDTAGGGTNTYNQVGSGANDATSNSVHVFYAIAKATETLNITCARTGGNSPRSQILAHVVSGANQTLGSLIDGTPTSSLVTYSASPQTGGSITTTFANVYLFSYWSTFREAETMTNNTTGFTKAGESITPYSQAAFYKIVSTTGTYNHSITYPSATAHVNFTVAFKGQ